MQRELQNVISFRTGYPESSPLGVHWFRTIFGENLLSIFRIKHFLQFFSFMICDLELIDTYNFKSQNV